MKTTKSINVSISLCDDCNKKETKEVCEACKKDLCKNCNVYKVDYDNVPIICKNCFDKLPKFVQDNMEAILTCEKDAPLHSEYYIQKGFYIFVVTHEDGGVVHYCKDKENVMEILDYYNSSDNEDDVSYVYDEKGNVYDVKRSAELKQIK